MKIVLTLLVAIALTLHSSQAKDLVNVDSNKIALSGYDPVAFFTDSKPVKGESTLQASAHGATYLFSSKAHQDAFVASPEKYLPQCGGYCAYGVSVGGLYSVDISTWMVHDGKLYLNKDPDVAKLFNANLVSNIAKSDKNWPSLVEHKGK